MNRRDFIVRSAQFTAGAAAVAAGASSLRAVEPPAPAQPAVPVKGREPLFRISLAQWSLNKRLFGRGGAAKLDNLDFAKTAKSYGIDAVEYVNQFFKDKAKDEKYLAEMKKRAADEGVRSLLIMCDGEGNLGDADEKKRTTAVENHYKWVEAAKFLGCHSIRVNAGSSGSYDEQVKRAADGLRRLTEFGDKHGLFVIVENHGGLSSNGAWLAQVMKTVDHPRCGTLPDFGNFRVSNTEEYDRYKGVAELMPYAKSVSAKTHDFNEKGEETRTDYRKMMKIVLDASPADWVKNGKYVGIEYEGGKVSEEDGIKLTKALLEKVREEMGK